MSLASSASAGPSSAMAPSATPRDDAPMPDDEHDDDVAHASTPHVGDVRLASPSPHTSARTPSPSVGGSGGSGRKSPSIAAMVAAIESGRMSPATMPTLPADEAMDSEEEDSVFDGTATDAEDDKITAARTPTRPPPAAMLASPPFSPSTPPPPPKSTPPPKADDASHPIMQHEAASKSASPSKMPIVKLLEVENELRKREVSIAGGELDGVTEEQDAESEDRSSPPAAQAAVGDAAGDADSKAGGSAVGSKTQYDDHSSLGTSAMEISDSEAGSSHLDSRPEGDEGPEEWEDFMARYWLNSSPSHVTLHDAAALIAAEDTDLTPCALEPELDEEPHALSPIRTGCIDIDMDFSLSNDGEKDGEKGGINHLSEMGLECTRAVARALWEGGGGMESLNIDVGRMMVDEEGSSQKEEVKGTEGETSGIILREWSSSVVDALEATSAASEAASATASAVSSENWKHKIAPLPQPELIHMTGPILTRTSLRSLVMKKWHPSYWMHYGPHALLIFRSKEHMDDWRSNPYHGKKQRDFLVKLKIDFLADMQQDDGSGKEGVLGHRILPVKRKSYGKHEPEVYQFKLERWTNLGCSVLAAFASQEEDGVQILHDTIGTILRKCPHGGLRNIDHMLK